MSVPNTDIIGSVTNEFIGRFITLFRDWIHNIKSVDFVDYSSNYLTLSSYHYYIILLRFNVTCNHLTACYNVLRVVGDVGVNMSSYLSKYKSQILINKIKFY